MTPTRIIKRTGEVVPFDGARIRAAIAKAVEATRGALDDAAVAELAGAIQEEMQERFFDFYPNVERRDHGDQSLRQTARRRLRLPGDLAPRHRGFPRSAQEHRRRAAAHACTT